MAAGVFAVNAFGAFRTPLIAGLLAFATGIGAYGWVGIFFVMSAEIGGPKDAGRAAPRLAGPAIDREARR